MSLSIYPLPPLAPEIAVSRRQVPGVTADQQFGRNPAVGTTFVPITSNGFYRTPQVSGATTLRIKAGGNAADTAAGVGARAVTLQGLDETGAFAEETLATNGALASGSTTTTFLRVYKAFVSASGTYATATAGSHAGDIVVENTAGTEDWLTILVAGFPTGETEIGVISVPLGKEMYISDTRISVDSTKVMDLILFQRRNILETSAPYTAMRAIEDHAGITETHDLAHVYPLGPFPALTDVGYMGKVAAGTADASVAFNYLLVDV